MTRKEIIRLAREAGFRTGQITMAIGDPIPFVTAVAATNFAVELERFAALVAAAEREECAKVCEEVSLQAVTAWKLAYQPQDQGREMGADECAAAIRARGAA